MIKNLLSVDLTLDASDILNKLTDWDKDKLELAGIVAINLEAAYGSGVKFVQGTNTNALLVNIKTINHNSRNYIETQTASEIRDITETTQKQIRNDIVSGLQAGETRRQMAERIKTTMGITSTSRAEMIAETESHNALSAGSFETAVSAELGSKTWNTVGDEAVRGNKPKDRANHVMLNGNTVPINDFFDNGLLFPGDSANGSAADVIRCRCFLTYDN